MTLVCVSLPSHKNKSIEVRKTDGTMVFNGPRQLSEMRGGRNRPGRFAAFMRISKLVDEEGERDKVIWAYETICK